MIYVIGNSHVRYFLGRDCTYDEEFVLDKQGLEVRIMQCGGTGATIWGLDHRASLTGAGHKIAETMEKHKPDMAVIVLGDVDLREHVWKHISEKRSFDTVIMELVEKYEDWLAQNVLPHTRHLVLNACPPFSLSYFKHSAAQNAWRVSLPYCIMRFNEMLERRCEVRGWTLFSHYESFTDAFGCLKLEFVRAQSDVEVHLEYDKAAEVFVPRLLELAQQKGLFAPTGTESVV